MWRRCTQLALAALLAQAPLWAQPRSGRDVWQAVRPPLRTFGPQEGPPNASVYAISEDRAGRLWVGTQDGTALYNGNTWTNLPLPPESPSQFVRAVAETPDGSRWFGTEGGGLWRLQAGRWSNLRAGAGFSSNTINSLTQIDEGSGRWSLWACTAGGGVARYDGQAWTFMGQAQGLPSSSAWKIRRLQTPQGGSRLWVATTRGFAELEGERWRAHTAKEGWPEEEANDITQVIQRDGSTHLWLSIWGRGLLRWDGQRWDAFNPKGGGFPSFFPINSLVIPDHQGQPVLWVSTYDRGLAWFANGAWRNLDTRKGLPANGIYSLFAPRRGKPTLWMGMRGGGLASLDLTGWYLVDEQMGLPSNEVHAFAETRDAQGERTLWIGTSEGLARWEGRGWKIDGTRSGLPHDHVACLLAVEGPQGSELWAGTLKGLARFTVQGWKTLFKTKGLQDQRVLCLLQTRGPDGLPIVWAGTDKGLLEVRGAQQNIHTAKDGLPSSQVFALAHTRDADGGESLWVGTRGQGIGRLKQGVWTRYGEAEGLFNLSVFCFKEAQTPDGRRWLWAGTFGGGAVRFDLDDPGAKRWERFYTGNLPGFPSNVVVRIESDPEGHVYLATQRGVVRLHFQDANRPGQPSRVETFTRGDGLPPVSTNYGASLLDATGRLWIATTQGAAVLDPTLEAPPPALPPMIVDHLMVGQQERALRTSENVLGYRENRLSFEMSIPSFYRDEDLRYRTQLIGLEAQPTPWSPSGRREMLALPEGHYTLRLEGRDHLDRRTPPLDFPLTIRPAPWRSLWAYTGYALLLLGAFALIYRIRTRLLRDRNLALEARVALATAELKEKNQALERLNTEKDHFMGIAAHDLKNPLNAVALAAQEIAEDDIERHEMVRFARMIERASRQMGSLIQNLLQVNRLDSGLLKLEPAPVDVVELARDVHHTFQPAAVAKSIRLDLESQGPETAWADPERLREILENFLSNAIKYTPPGPPERRVTTRVRRVPEGTLLEVQDEGPGFTPEDKVKVFGRFVQLSARPTAGEGSSGLGLSIVKKLVEAMHGQVSLHSEVGQGATFRIILPLPPAEAD